MSSTSEDYLKRILAESRRNGEELVSLGYIAESSKVTQGTVTTMMQSLADSGFVEYLPRRGVKLTPLGRENATRMLRRHRLIELFLVEILQLDWSEVHTEAEILEHAVSDRFVDRIDEILNHPTLDPHGDPIPTADGNIMESSSRPLSDAVVTGAYRISRITNDEPDFLDFIKAKDLVPGRSIQVSERDADAGTIRIGVKGNDVTLSLGVAGRILVDFNE